MTVISEVMSETVETARTADHVDAVRAVMQDIGVHALPVIDGDGELVGIVSSLDLADSLAPSEPVAGVMSNDVHTVLPETEVAMAALFMREYQINHLVVTTRNGTIAGIVSAWDLLASLAASVRAHTVETVDVAPVAKGDELIVDRPDGSTLRCRVDDVHGPGGLPPYVVIWDDDDTGTRLPIGIERHTDIALDGCER